MCDGVTGRRVVNADIIGVKVHFPLWRILARFFKDHGKNCKIIFISVVLEQFRAIAPQPV